MTTRPVDATETVLTDVIKPFAFTVTTGIKLEEPNVPTLEFTVARVVTLVLPDDVTSPVILALTNTEFAVPLRFP